MADAGSSNQVEEVLAKVDLAEIVGEYVSLKKSGRSLKGLCPFHEEKTPSFFVSPEKQVFYCFGCGAGGNAITFVKNIEKVSFGEALEQVARRAGITLTSANAEGNREKQQIYQANRWAAGVYQKVLFLPEGKVGLNYLSSRGLGEEEIKRYGLGYAPAQPDFLLSRMKQEGLNPTVLKKAGLIDSSGTRDIFRRRVLFTIYDIRGEILGFGGRAVEEHQEPKYLNTGETPVFSKGRVLYGLNWAREGIREAGYALMVEGYFDVLRLHQHGFRNAVAPLGTALTDGHLRLLRRFTERLLLLFDADEAGTRAALRHLELILRNGFEVKVGALPGGFDPDKFIEDYGKEAFRKFMLGAQDFLEFGLAVLSRMHDGATPRGKSTLARELTFLIGCLPDEIEQTEHLKRLGERLEIPVPVLQRLLRARPEETTVVSPGKVAGVKKRRHELAERELMQVVLADPSYWERLAREKGKLTERMEQILSLEDALSQEKLPVNAATLMSRATDEKLQTWLAEVAMSAGEMLGQEKKEKVFTDCVQCLIKHEHARKAREKLEVIKAKSSGGEIDRQDLIDVQNHLITMKKG